MAQPADLNYADAPSIPDLRTGRLLLFAMRRMAVAGLDDAHAAHAIFAHFGISYRRPLILIRAMMAEIARASKQTVKVAPCCCLRMTADEAVLLSTVEHAQSHPRRAHTLLSDLMGTPDCLGVLTTAQAVGQAFTDLGKPLALFLREM